MIKKILFVLVIGLVAGLVALPFLVIDSEPAIAGGVQYNAVEIDRAKALIKRNDPRRFDAGQIVTQWVDQEEISLIAGYLLGQLEGGAVSVQFHPGLAYISLTLNLPDNPIGPYMNFSMILSQWSNTLSIESMTLGKISVPGWLAEMMKQYANKALMNIPEYKASISALNGLQILEDRMLVVYQWRPELVDQLKNTGKEMLVDEALRTRLLAYSKQINNIAANPALGDSVSITDFLTPLFFLAQARGEDPIEENRAALLALSFYFSGVDIARMIGVDLPDSKSVSKHLTLSGRYDFTQHFLTSAALTLTGGTGLADKIGMFKELDDAQGGSGFSFTDIGADRSGVRVAELAIANEASARKVQNIMTGRLKEEDFMANFLDLPELMPNDEFKRRFGGITDPRYLKVIEDIESRINAVPLFR